MCLVQIDERVYVTGETRSSEQGDCYSADQCGRNFRVFEGCRHRGESAEERIGDRTSRHFSKRGDASGR